MNNEALKQTWDRYVDDLYEQVVREVERKQTLITVSADNAGDLIADIISRHVEGAIGEFSGTTLIQFANLRNVWGDVWEARHAFAGEEAPFRMALETVIAKEFVMDVSDRIYGA